MTIRVWCAFAALMMAAPCFAAGQTWNGLWKLNDAKSKFTADPFAIEAKGMSRIVRHANESPD
jgi:hypothetical protein